MGTEASIENQEKSLLSDEERLKFELEKLRKINELSLELEDIWFDKNELLYKLANRETYGAGDEEWDEIIELRKRETTAYEELSNLRFALKKLNNQSNESEDGKPESNEEQQ